MSNKRINLVVSEKRKKKWDAYIEDKNISLSQLIRESVDQYIKTDKLNKEIQQLSDHNHKIREELTSIKGFSQMLFSEYKDQLDWEVLVKIKKIVDKSINIERILDRALKEEYIDRQSYDILIVDDDPTTLELLSDHFNRRGYSTKTTSNGSETLEFLEFSIPKLILLDILLPDMSGYEICQRIKDDDRLKNVPVYYITAVPRNEVSQKMNETNAEGYITKPFDIEKDFTHLIESL